MNYGTILILSIIILYVGISLNPSEPKVAPSPSSNMAPNVIHTQPTCVTEQVI